MANETVYSAASPLLAPRRFLASALRDLRAVPAAGWRLFARTLQARYRQSALRWAWIVVPPLVTTLTWVFLSRAGVIHIKGTGMPYAAYVGSGAVAFQLFLDCLNAPMTRLAAATEVLKYARLPHESWVVAGLLDALFGFVVRLALLVPLLIVLGSLGGPTLLLVPVGAFGLATLGLGLGLLLAVPGRLYSDVAQALTVVTTLLFFLTPVFYVPPTTGVIAKLLSLNPITPGVVTTRAWLTGTHAGDVGTFAAVTAGAVVLLGVAWLLYRLAQPHLVARL
jgi:lipopolysaccharide transport system permease protein